MLEYPLLLSDDKELASRLSQFFTRDRIEIIARSTKFVLRKSSRLTGLSFLELNVFSLGNEDEKSLEDQCDYLEDNFGVFMKKQSLDERYNTHSVSFMKSCYAALLEEVLQPYLRPPAMVWEKSFDVFNGIELADSTSFELPDSMGVFYKGGSKSVSSVKIQHRYELMKGETVALKIVSGDEHDSFYLKDLVNGIISKRLYIKDLGYYDLNYLAHIAENGGFFLSRYRTRTACFIKNGRGKFESTLINDLVPAYGLNRDVSMIYIGSKKMKVRMIIESIPEEHLEERRNRVLKKNKSNGYDTLHADSMLLCQYNIYITNVEESILGMARVRWLYALRWQIELIFKIWKSVFDMDKVKQMSVFRFECYLYGRLMVILLSEKIQNLYRDYLWEEEYLEISPYKCAKIVKKNLVHSEER